MKLPAAPALCAALARPDIEWLLLALADAEPVAVAGHFCWACAGLGVPLLTHRAKPLPMTAAARLKTTARVRLHRLAPAARLAGWCCWDIVRPTWKWRAACWAPSRAAPAFCVGAAATAQPAGGGAAGRHRDADPGHACRASSATTAAPAGARPALHRRGRAGGQHPGALRSPAAGDLRMMLPPCCPGSWGVLALALALNAWRLLRGPGLPDRILALDTLYINALALLVVLGLWQGTQVYFEAALLMALLGFISTVALARYVTSGAAQAMALWPSAGGIARWSARLRARARQQGPAMTSSRHASAPARPTSLGVHCCCWWARPLRCWVLGAGELLERLLQAPARPQQGQHAGRGLPAAGRHGPVLRRCKAQPAGTNCGWRCSWPSRRRCRPSCWCRRRCGWTAAPRPHCPMHHALRKRNLHPRLVQAAQQRARLTSERTLPGPSRGRRSSSDGQLQPVGGKVAQLHRRRRVAQHARHGGHGRAELRHQRVQVGAVGHLHRAWSAPPWRRPARSSRPAA
jgi:multicomponent K+:H+ antiporter subunit F